MSGLQGIIGLSFTLLFCSFCMGDWLHGFRWRELFLNLGLQILAIVGLAGLYGLLTLINAAFGRQP